MRQRVEKSTLVGLRLISSEGKHSRSRWGHRAREVVWDEGAGGRTASADLPSRRRASATIISFLRGSYFVKPRTPICRSLLSLRDILPSRLLSTAGRLSCRRVPPLLQRRSMLHLMWSATLSIVHHHAVNLRRIKIGSKASGDRRTRYPTLIRPWRPRAALAPLESTTWVLCKS